MKRFCTLLVAVLAVVMMPVCVSAELIDNLDGTITDTDTNLMWLQDANYAKTSGYHSSGNFDWITAKTWAENLDFAGYSDWRLPSALNSDKTGPCSGYNCSDSEMGHLYYDELGNLAYDPVTNTGPFANLVTAGNWSSTVDASDPEKAFIFNFNVGNQGPDNKGVNNWALAVRDIDNDGDGIPDDEDACPYSDLSETVIIDGWDSEVDNVLLEDGCTISDLISECADDAANHGEFVSAVSHTTNSLKKEGIISGKEKGMIQKGAARAAIP